MRHFKSPSQSSIPMIRQRPAKGPAGAATSMDPHPRPPRAEMVAGGDERPRTFTAVRLLVVFSTARGGSSTVNGVTLRALQPHRPLAPPAEPGGGHGNRR